MGIIFYLSTLQKIGVTDSYIVSFLFFKTIHLIEYSILFLLLYRSIRLGLGYVSYTSYIISLVILILFALSDEYHQTLVPTREGRLRDAIIDMIGGGTGWIMHRYFIRKLPRRLLTLVEKLGMK